MGREGRARTGRTTANRVKEMQGRFADADDSGEEGEEEEEEEEEENDAVDVGEDWEEAPECCRSLFEPLEFATVEEAMEHDGRVGLDVAAFQRLSVYERIKVVNWCRTTGAKDFAARRAEWEGETFLRPVLQDDPYLTWDKGDDDDPLGEAVIDERMQDELDAMQEALKAQGLSVGDLQK
jgi:hypothetical protein